VKDLKEEETLRTLRTSRNPILNSKNFETQEHALAYLMGVYLSDGNLGTDSGRFGLCVTDEIFRDEAAKAMNLVGSKYSLKSLPPQRPLGKKRRFFLWERSPYKVGHWLENEFPNGKDHLPNIPDDLAQDLVAGILDGDGSICRAKRGGYDIYQLKVCGYSDYLWDLPELFERFGVIMHYCPGENGHNINLKSFVRAWFYFRMPRKQKLVEEYVKKFTLGYTLD